MSRSKRSVVSRGLGLAFTLGIALVALASISCASHEPVAVRSVAQRQLRCAADDIYAVVNRTTPRVQEWIVGCEFYYTRVLCTSDGCRVPTPKPPCFGENECFEEDPMTLEWTLPHVASR